MQELNNPGWVKGYLNTPNLFSAFQFSLSLKFCNCFRGFWFWLHALFAMGAWEKFINAFLPLNCSGNLLQHNVMLLNWKVLIILIGGVSFIAYIQNPCYCIRVLRKKLLRIESLWSDSVSDSDWHTADMHVVSQYLWSKICPC